MVKLYGREIGGKIGTVTKERNGQTVTSSVYKDSKGRTTYVVDKKESTKSVKKQKSSISKIESGETISKSEYKELERAGILKETDEGTVLTRSASTVGITRVGQEQTPSHQVIGFTGKNLRDYDGKYKVQTKVPGRYVGDQPTTKVDELSRSEFMKQFPDEYSRIQRSGSKQYVTGTVLKSKSTVGIGSFGEKLSVTDQKDPLSGRSISYDGEVYNIQTEKKISRKLNDTQKLNVEFDPVTQAGTVESIRKVKDEKIKQPSRYLNVLSDDVALGPFGLLKVKRRTVQEGWLKPVGDVSSSFMNTLAFKETDYIERRLRTGSPWEAVGTLGAFGLQVGTLGKGGELIKAATGYAAGASSTSAAAIAAAEAAQIANVLKSTGMTSIVVGAATPSLVWGGVKQLKGDAYKQMEVDPVLTSAYAAGISKSLRTGETIADYKKSLQQSKLGEDGFINVALDKSILLTSKMYPKNEMVQGAFFSTSKFIDDQLGGILLGRGNKQDFLTGAQESVSPVLTSKELGFLSTKRETMKWSEPAAIVISGMGTELIGRATIPSALGKMGNIAAKNTWFKVASTSAYKIAPLGFMEGVAVTVSGSAARGQKVTGGQLLQAGVIGAGSAAVVGGIIGGRQFAKTKRGRVAGKFTETASYFADPGEYFGDASANFLMKMTGLKEQAGVLTGVSRKFAGKKTGQILAKQKYRSLSFVPTTTKSMTQTKIQTQIPTQIPTIKNSLSANIFSNMPTSIKSSIGTTIKTSPTTQSNIFTNIFTNNNVPSNVYSAVPSNVNANIFTNIPVSTQVPVSTNVPVTVRTNVFTPQLDIPFIPPGMGYGGRRPKRGSRTKKGYETKFVSSIKKFVTTGKVTIKKTKLYK